MILCSGFYFGVFLCALIMLMHLVPSFGLQCYNCTTTWEYGACVLEPNTTRVVTCDSNQSFCLVQRNETFGKFDVLIRRCATSCSPHCGIWGDDIDTERCFSCCTTDLCNIDNSSHGIHVPVVTLNIINIMFLLIM